MGSILAAPGTDLVLCGWAELPAVGTTLTRTWCKLLWVGEIGSRDGGESHGEGRPTEKTVVVVERRGRGGGR
jgi:hypothetical protein